MALNKKGGFGFDLEKTFKDVETVDSVKPTGTHTHTYTHTDTYTDKETKKKRTNGLVKQSVFDKVSAHADKRGTSFNAIVCELLDEYIERNGL